MCPGLPMKRRLLNVLFALPLLLALASAACWFRSYRTRDRLAYRAESWLVALESNKGNVCLRLIHGSGPPPPPRPRPLLSRTANYGVLGMWAAYQDFEPFDELARPGWHWRRAASGDDDSAWANADADGGWV